MVVPGEPCSSKQHVPPAAGRAATTVLLLSLFWKAEPSSWISCKAAENPEVFEVLEEREDQEVAGAVFGSFLKETAHQSQIWPRALRFPGLGGVWHRLSVHVNRHTQQCPWRVWEPFGAYGLCIQRRWLMRPFLRSLFIVSNALRPLGLVLLDGWWEMVGTTDGVIEHHPFWNGSGMVLELEKLSLLPLCHFCLWAKLIILSSLPFPYWNRR